MDRQLNVLVFPAGEINALEIHEALSWTVNVKVIGASSVDRHGPYVYEHYRSGLPMISEPCFLDTVNRLIDEEDIDVIFPTHDSVALFLSDNRERIKAPLVCAGKETTRLCRDKALTYQRFKGFPFVPDVIDSDTAGLEYPLFSKPKQGQGSVNARRIDTVAELNAALNDDSLIVTEYFPGRELTVDCLTNSRGELKVCLPRSRDRTMAGITVSGKAEDCTPGILEIAECLNRELDFLGLWFFQIKEDRSGHFKLLEISTRCAGTMCLSRARGVNLPLLSIMAVLGLDFEVMANSLAIEMDRTLISRYRLDYPIESVYLDYDDTVIIRGKVNLKAVWFLYQCVNRQIPVILMTKHAGDIHADLSDHRIDPGLFESIVVLNINEEKWKKINRPGAIFIDNSYRERRSVSSRLGIPVFDVDAFEVLMDWRI
jgi:hypothetical protein